METDYYVFIHRPGPNWHEGKPVTEQPLEGHFSYMSELEESGILVAGGGFTDGAGAMGIVCAETLAEAEGHVVRDPAVATQIVATEVHPRFVTVGGEITRS